MKTPTSQADIITDWEELLDAVQKNPDLQPIVETERQSLTQLLAEVQSLKGRQNELRGLRQEVTQQLAAAVKEGRDTAIKVRSVVRGKIGPRNERLVHFKISPIGRRPRKAKQEPAEEAPGKNPGPSASPAGGTAA